MIEKTESDISRYYGDTKPVNGLDHAEGASLAQIDPNAGQVYFISDGENIKIGYSARALLRMGDLQSSTPRTLKLLGSVAGTMKDEQQLHTRFRHIRVRGEWFRSSPDLLEHIARVCDPRAPVKEEAERVRLGFRRWAFGRPGIDRNLVWVIDRQIMVAARYDDPTLREIIVENLDRVRQ